MTSAAPQESAPERELGDHRYWAFVVDANYDPKSLFVSNTSIRWRLRRPLPVKSGDIVYILSIGGRGLVGWALVREGATSQPPSSEGVQISLQMLANTNKEVTLGQVARRLRVTQNVLQTERQLEIAKDSADKLNDLFDDIDIPNPETNPEVIKFRSELAERGQMASSAQIAIEGVANVAVDANIEAGIGPLAAVEGKWARLTDVLDLALADGSNCISTGLRTAMEFASDFSERTSAEGYRIVDVVVLLKAILSVGKLRTGDPSEQVTLGGSIFAWLSSRFDGVEAVIPDLPAPLDRQAVINAVASPEVTTALAEAAKIVQATHPVQTRLDIRHTVTALLLSEPGRRALTDVGSVRGDLRPFFRELGTIVREHVIQRSSESGDDIKAWDRIFTRFNDLDLPPTPGKATRTVQHTAYAADRPGRLADDALDVAKDARAFAELICLEEAQPPLAIGLFGDWGSGKSTFMEMLAEAIDEVATRAAQESSLPFVGRVAHIRFNAWHYIDANLWASLVTHIFKELHLQSRDKDQPRDWLKEVQLDGLIQRLGIVQQAEGEARGQLEVLSKQIDDAKGRLADIDQERITAKLQLAGDYVGDMLELISVGGPNSDVGNAARTIGLGVDTLTARQLHDTISEAATLGGRLKLLVTTLTMGTDKGLKWLLLGIVVFIAVGGAVATLAALLPGLHSIATTLGTILGLVSGAGAWLGPHLRHINKALGPLIDAHNDIMIKFQQEEHERAAKKAEAKAKLGQLEVQQKHQERSLQEKLEERQRLEAIARGERPTELLARFIESRTQAEDYRKHLGLLSFVRSDFEKVSTLMREQRKTPDPSLPAIDRVVLYIDDLDRCQDKQVVQVLEAVHLLLAFDLFVVVVGVDARWLHRALEKIYPDQLGEPGANHASPADYLEKIFQIPFWLRSLDYGEQGTFGRLIDKLVGADVEQTTPPPVDTSAAADGASRRRTADKRQSPDSVESDGHDVTPAIAPITVTLADEKPEETLQRVKLRDTEIALMKALGLLIGKSPRAAKRFVNLYRLVRARKRGAELERFLNNSNDEPAQYPAVMLALAIEVGLSPAEAAAAWQHIQSLDESVRVELPFEAGNGESDRKIEAAINVVQRATGLPLLREHVVSILGEISRYSFSRPI